MNTLVVFFLIAIMAVSVHADPDPIRLRGRWGGTLTLKHKTYTDMRQHTLNYTLSVTIVRLFEHEKSGDIWWPELGCRTELTFIHAIGGVAKFMSQPMAKPCMSNVLSIKFLTPNQIEVTFLSGVMNPMGTTTLTRLTPVEAPEVVQQ